MFCIKYGKILLPSGADPTLITSTMTETVLIQIMDWHQGSCNQIVFHPHENNIRAD
jgi:uncharacterized membrane protein YjjP (DUF1212 family)